MLDIDNIPFIDTSITIGTGLGFKYDVGNVSIIMALPVTDFEDMLDDESRVFFANTRSASNRIGTKLPPSTKGYDGSWYWQSTEPTCLPWAIVNAMHVVGITPDNQLVSDLLNCAIDIERSKNKGMDYLRAIEILNRYPDLGVMIKNIPYAHQLRLIIERPSQDFLKMDQITDLISQTSEQVSSNYSSFESSNSQLIQSNGTLIKETIDSGEVLLTSVMSHIYSGSNKSGLHAISVIGYSISDSGNMDVQILDSDRGKIWMSLEHLSSAIVPPDTFRTIKKAETKD